MGVGDLVGIGKNLGLSATRGSEILLAPQVIFSLIFKGFDDPAGNLTTMVSFDYKENQSSG